MTERREPTVVTELNNGVVNQPLLQPVVFSSLSSLESGLPFECLPASDISSEMLNM